MASINDPMSVGRELQTESYNILAKHGMQDATELAISAIYFNPLDPVGGLMGALDKGLSTSEEEGESNIHVAFMGNGGRHRCHAGNGNLARHFQRSLRQ